MNYRRCSPTVTSVATRQAQQRITRNHSPRSTSQRQQQIVFQPGDVHVFAIELYATRRDIKPSARDVSAAHLPVQVVTDGAARSNPRQQLAD